MSNLIRRPFLSDELSRAEISRCGKLFAGAAPFSARNVIIIIMKFHLDRVDSIKQCRSYGLSLWQCPQFLFLIMGAITIISIIATYFASRYYIQEPEVVALIVLAVAAIIFIIGHIIVSSFDMIASASRAKSEFVSIMSHQLRTPLSIIKWQLNLIYEKHIGTENSEIKKFLDHLGEENQRMLHIINDLLELNRIEDRNLYLNPSNFSLGEVVGDLIDRRNKSLLEAESNVFIETKIPENLPDVFADKIKDAMLFADIKRISNIDADVILFNIDSRADSTEGRSAILSVFWRLFNESQGFCSDSLHLAEIERYLTRKGHYQAFKEKFKEIYGSEWETERDPFSLLQDEIVEALSMVLDKNPDATREWFEKYENNFSLTVEQFAKRVKEYLDSKAPNHRIIFLVDEIGKGLQSCN